MVRPVRYTKKTFAFCKLHMRIANYRAAEGASRPWMRFGRLACDKGIAPVAAAKISVKFPTVEFDQAAGKIGS